MQATILRYVSDVKQHPLQALIGGPRGALESILPPLAFITTYIATGDNMTLAVSVAVGLGLVFAIWRLVQGKRPTRVLGALLVVVISAYVAARTGSAAAFFWPRVLLNIASGLAFAISIFVRWPLLGVIVGPIVEIHQVKCNDYRITVTAIGLSWNLKLSLNPTLQHMQLQRQSNYCD